MTHLIKVIKAGSLRSMWYNLLEAKRGGLLHCTNLDLKPLRRDFGTNVRNYIGDSFLGNYIYRIGSEHSMESLFWKSLLGFFGGVLLAYLFFFFFYIGMNLSLRHVTFLCGLIGIWLCLGLAFSSSIRCYIFLLLPVFFSKQGRQALIAYALFLAFTGPGKNTMHNMGVLSESMTCGQQMIKKTLKQLIDMVKAPFRSVRDTLDKLTETVKHVVAIIKNFVMKISRIIVSLLFVIRNVSDWLRSIVNLCNKKVGTPFQRCMKTFDFAITDCKAKLGIMDFMCHVVHIVQELCYTVKWMDFICIYTDFVSDTIVDRIKRKLRSFTHHMDSLFRVSVEFGHTYEYEAGCANATSEVEKTILQKISEKVERVQTIFGLFGFLFGFLFLFVFFKVHYYKYKYLTSDKYDNYYISNYIIELDLKRAAMDRETVLPLEIREKRKYARPTALRLLKAEKNRMAQSAFLLTLTSFKIVSFLMCDYSLFWTLRTIYEAGKEEINQVERPKIGVHVRGRGIVAKFYKSMGKTFQVPENPYAHPNPLHCLPDPVEPDTGRYMQIGFLLGLSWLLSLLEPYGLRLRNIVMSHYYPDRAKQRAVWLYNHILRCRGSFIKFTRRQLRRKFLIVGEPIKRISLFRRILSYLPVLGAIISSNKENCCVLCHAVENKQDLLKFCATDDCKGSYCMKCYLTVQNICTICQHPLEYGDISDISEEVDSSEDDLCQSQDTTNSSDPVDDKYLTFKEMEVRDNFRDLEANKKIDYAKLTDLCTKKQILQKRLKEILISRLRHLEAEKRLQKRNRIEEIKSRLREITSKLREKRNARGATLKSSMRKKLRSRSDLCLIREEAERLLQEDSPKPSKVSFQLNPEIKLYEKDCAGKDELVREIKEKIRRILRTKNLRNTNVQNGRSDEIIEHLSVNSRKSNCSSSSSSSSHSGRVCRSVQQSPRTNCRSPRSKSAPGAFTYYFVENEKKVFLPTEKISDIKFEGPRRRVSTKEKYYF